MMKNDIPTTGSPNGAAPPQVQRPISLLICALGGEGGGVLTEWLVETARVAGYPAQSTSIPGVAQRTGATTYYLEVFPMTLAELGTRRPVFSLNPVPGALDAIVSSELLEASRQVAAGMASAERTLLITSSSRTFTTQERMQPGDGRTDSAELVQLVRSHSREHHVLDMAELARDNGTVVSAVMLGALAASGLFPFQREHYEAVVQAGGRSAEASLRGFAAAYARVSQMREQARFVADLLAPGHSDVPGEPAVPSTLAPALRAEVATFPAPLHALLNLAVQRLVDYQSPAYAHLYLQRMRQVVVAEHTAQEAASASGAPAYGISLEMGRWLVLWMAFDDIVRVADLKSRQSRWQRVRHEVKAAEADLLKVYDHFKPGAPEFAALLPPGLAQRVLRWDAQRVAKGKAPWALPLKVGTHSVVGMLALRLLAACRRLRPLGSRYAAEQAMMERWLQGVLSGTARDGALGHELALCGRLIKGYGATNERGKDNLLHVLDHLAHLPDPAVAAMAVAAARKAALADEAGNQLDATLREHGAPPRPVKPQPIRWMRKPPAKAAARSTA